MISDEEVLDAMERISSSEFATRTGIFLQSGILNRFAEEASRIGAVTAEKALKLRSLSQRADRIKSELLAKASAQTIEIVPADRPVDKFDHPSNRPEGWDNDQG